MCVFVGFNNFGNLISIIVFEEQHMPNKKMNSKEEINERKKLTKKTTKYSEGLAKENKTRTQMKQMERSQNQNEIKQQQKKNWSCKLARMSETTHRDKPSEYRIAILLKSLRKHNLSDKEKRKTMSKRKPTIERKQNNGKKYPKSIEMNEIRVK